MNETDLHRHLKIGLLEQGDWCFKIPDQVMGMEKPFDIVASLSGRFLAIEAKMVKYETITEKKTILSLASFKNRTHQLRTLNEISNKGGLAVIVVGIYQSISPYEKTCYAFDAASYNEETISLSSVRSRVSSGTNVIDELTYAGGGVLGARWSWPKDYHLR